MNKKLEIEVGLGLSGASQLESTRCVVPDRTVGGSEHHGVGSACFPHWGSEIAMHALSVYELAYSLIGDTHDAEDPMQDVFVRVVECRSAYALGTFEHQLRSTTKGLLRSSGRRKRSVRDDAALEEHGDVVVALEPMPMPAPAAEFGDPRFGCEVKAALDDLPPDVRSVILLHDIEGLTSEETAMTLGIKVETVRGRADRGRAQLRIALAHWAPRGAGALAPGA
jgi:RNA polymerase sigma factor (sigma-70 family)